MFWKTTALTRGIRPASHREIPAVVPKVGGDGHAVGRVRRVGAGIAPPDEIGPSADVIIRRRVGVGDSQTALLQAPWQARGVFADLVARRRSGELLGRGGHAEGACAAEEEADEAWEVSLKLHFDRSGQVCFSQKMLGYA